VTEAGFEFSVFVINVDAGKCMIRAPVAGAKWVGVKEIDAI
jgi:RNA polymerase-interacting CarD/CdnL/TRCF family regulator